MFELIQKSAIEEAVSVEQLLPHFVRVTDIDNSPDLTDVHPRDRKDMNLCFVPIDNILFPQTAALIKAMPKIRNANIIALEPQSQLYPHVDTIELAPYAEIDWLSVYMGLFVPSLDPSKVAVKIGNTVYNHKETIIFDTQIPHSAWNWTNEWWVSIRLAVCRSAFK